MLITVNRLYGGGKVYINVNNLLYIQYNTTSDEHKQYATLYFNNINITVKSSIEDIKQKIEEIQ